jgi:hypothetical protein
LVEALRSSLPTNLALIQNRLQEIKGHIAQLPPAPDLADLPLELERVISNFTSHVRKTFDGAMQADQPMLREWNEYASQFRSYITSSYPVLTLLTADDDRQSNLAAAKKARAAGSSIIKKPGKSTGPIDISSDEESASSLSRQNARSFKLKGKDKDDKANVLAAYNGLTCRFSLDQVRTINQKYAITGMPRQAYPQALQDMMTMSVAKWDDALIEFMNAVSKMINTALRSTIFDVFRRFQAFPFFAAVLDWAKGYLLKVIQEEWSRAERLLEVEQGLPYTLDVDTHKAKYQQNLAEKIGKRNGLRLKTMKAKLEASGSKSKKKLSLDVLPPDQYQIELEMAAHVRAYYDIAASRFADVICHGIVARLFPACSEKLVTDLKDYIGLDRPDQQAQLREWMSESPDVERQRRDLLQERQKLIEGREHIISVLGSAADEPKPRSTSDELTARSPADDNRSRFNSTPSSKRTVGNTPTSTPTKRGAPEDFEKQPPLTNKKLGAISKLSIRPSPDRATKGSATNRQAGAQTVLDEEDETDDEGVAFL